MDWQQAAVSTGAVAVGYVVMYIDRKIAAARVAAQTDKRIETIEGVVVKHAERLDGVDTKFDELNTRFVPRQELESSMDSIKETLKRMERWMERLILGRTPPLE